MKPRKFAATSALLGSLLALSACGKPDVYPLSMAEAYMRLNTVQIEPSGDGVFYGLETSVSGNSVDRVTWSASDAYAAHSCLLGLKKVDVGRTQVTITCEGGSPTSGAAEHSMVRNRVIEMVDATLTGRKFDPQLADGTTAWRWPGDGGGGSAANAAAEAIEMDAEMRMEAGDAPAVAQRPDSEDPAPAAEDVSPEF